MDEATAAVATAGKPTKLRRNSKYAWACLWAIYLASVVGPICQFKVPPLAPWIIPAFGGMDSGTFGWLMGLMSVVGVVLAFPTVFIVKKMGLKGTILLAVGCLLAGSLVEIASGYMAGGAVAAAGGMPAGIAAGGSFVPMLFIGRVIEGTGIGLLGVAGSTAVTVWFSPEKRGLPLAIWATWFPVGTLVMMNVSPLLAGGTVAGGAAADPNGWLTVFWIATIITAIAFVVFAIVYKTPQDVPEEEAVVTAKPSEMFKVIKNKNIWMLGIIFFCFNYYVLGVVNSFYNQYLINIGGMSADIASPFVSICTLIGLVLMPCLGAWSDKIGKRRIFVIWGAIIMFAGCFLGFTGQTAIIMPLAFIILVGISMSIVSCVARPIAPEIMPATAVGATMGMVVMQFTQQLAGTFGSPIFGMVLDGAGGAMSLGAWMIAGYATLIPILAIQIIAAFILKSR